MLTNDGYALLIGIDDYSAFDRSTGQKIGTSDLRGSRNDVRTFWRQCRLVGMKPANIRVLASPPIDFNELEGASPENVALATQAGIEAGAAWLASNLGQSSRPTGLLTYSGHGDWLASEGLVLCPSDVTDAGSAGGDVSLAHAVSFHALNAAFASHDAAENLTVVLDTCHSGGSTAVTRSQANRKTGHPLSLTSRPISKIAEVLLGKTPAAPLEALNGRVLAAAGREQVAYQSMFGGHFHGVFSWAIAAALEQWKPTQDGSNVRIDMSYDKLLQTAQRLISALWFNQTPELHGPVGVGALAVFQQGLVANPSWTKDLPDGGFKTEEIDGGLRDYLVYSLTQAGVAVGQVLVTNTAGGGYDANMEYWVMHSNVSMGSALTMSSGASQYWSTPPSLGTTSFKMDKRPSWASATPSGTLLLWANPSGNGERVGINWQMTDTRGNWAGSITWWHTTTGYVFGPSESNTLSPGTPAAVTWYSFTNTPI